MTNGFIVKSACFVVVACAVACNTSLADDPAEQGGELVATDGGAPSCAPMDAKAEGDCRAIVGTAWNGSACVMLAGCSCVGADCARATATECQAVANVCTGPVKTDGGGATDAGATDAGATTLCDTRRVACRSLPPLCPAGQVPSVQVSNPADPASVGCWGPCVPLEQCACSGPNGGDECPADTACWGHVNHCGPYVR